MVVLAQLQDLEARFQKALLGGEPSVRTAITVVLSARPDVDESVTAAAVEVVAASLAAAAAH